jgi:hypothetical protein
MMSDEERDRYSRSARSDDLRFGARSIYGANTRRGLVEVTLGANTILVEPAKAREMAGFLLEAASAAEGDETLMRVLDRVGMSQQRAAQVLLAMRTERQIIERKARAEARRAMVEDEEDLDAPGSVE